MSTEGSKCENISRTRVKTAFTDYLLGTGRKIEFRFHLRSKFLSICRHQNYVRPNLVDSSVNECFGVEVKIGIGRYEKRQLNFATEIDFFAIAFISSSY